MKHVSSIFTRLVAVAFLTIASASMVSAGQGAGIGKERERSSRQERDARLQRQAGVPATFQIAAKSVAECRTSASACATRATGNVLACAHDAYSDGVLEKDYCPGWVDASVYANCRAMNTNCFLESATTPNVVASTTASQILGIAGDTMIETTCPGSHRVEALRVRWGRENRSNVNGIEYVNSIELHCSRGGNDAADWRFARASTGEKGHTFRCNPGQLLSGIGVKYGQWIDAVSGTCTDVNTSSPTTKTSIWMGGNAASSLTELTCSRSPARYVYGIRYAKRTTAAHPSIGKLQLLCK